MICTYFFTLYVKLNKINGNFLFPQFLSEIFGTYIVFCYSFILILQLILASILFRLKTQDIFLIKIFHKILQTLLKKAHSIKLISTYILS